ncbi:hypothetical protein GRI62_06105 [Erythrobacter arachoides]|uniref:YMGG-like Gly-zipper domain-containing protein n=1 Tax=Aurantiacibacter arachoides TaxID=1850444 RepID=A0A845A0V2_9SPHN|nr:glycine zipper domain-containing protein [Aurantiacibacter arachoides]MXO93180.1 hypothetical protein [Aurantiacibacter arachoides]GGD51394.1 hypothetical protein GCM10011411_09040 [Aurantiacibacter arachoides]
MTSKMLIAPALVASAFGLGGCAQNYAVEGGLAGAAAGAAVAAITDQDITTYALAGAAVGAVVGYVSDKDDDCDGYYYDGRYVDDDCRSDDRYRRYF